jgi:hypothetical protein
MVVVRGGIISIWCKQKGKSMFSLGGKSDFVGMCLE